MYVFFTVLVFELVSNLSQQGVSFFICVTQSILRFIENNKQE